MSEYFLLVVILGIPLGIMFVMMILEVCGIQTSPDPQFWAGQKVEHISGGPVMVVENVDNLIRGTEVLCSWFEGNICKKQTFNVACLKTELEFCRKDNKKMLKK